MCFGAAVPVHQISPRPFPLSPATDRRQVPAAAPAAQPWTVLAHIYPQPSPSNLGLRLLDHRHVAVPDPLLLRHRRPGPAGNLAHWRDVFAERAVCGAVLCRSGRGSGQRDSAVPDPRPRFDLRVKNCGTRCLITPPRSPKANAICERLNETPRHDCLDHVIVRDATANVF